MKVLSTLGILVFTFLLSFGPLAGIAWLAGYDVFPPHRGWLLAAYVCVCGACWVKSMIEIFDA